MNEIGNNEQSAQIPTTSKLSCGCLAFVMLLLVASWIGSCGNEAKEPPLTAEQQAALEAKQKAEAEQAAEQQAIAAENAKVAFNEWNSTVQGYLLEVDVAWDELWKGTTAAVGNHTMDIYTAYNNIDRLGKKLETARDKFLELKTPEGLSNEQAKLLSNANSNYVAWIYCRREACDKFKEGLDKGNLSPSVAKDISDTINEGDLLATQAANLIVRVKNQLGQ